VDATAFDGSTLGNLAKIIYKQEPLILHALGISRDRLNRQPQHYDNSRYHGVNLHNVWYRGTVEFRWFEATLHAGWRIDPRQRGNPAGRRLPRNCRADARPDAVYRQPSTPGLHDQGVLFGIEAGPTQPLPEDAAAAAAEFLTRLARHGLIEFLPDDKDSAPWPDRCLEALETVRLSGRTNMLDHPEVTRLTAEMGYPEVAEWLSDHRREYSAFVLEGTRPLGKNFGGKEDPAPCPDK
jgi:hypothetical protein